MALFYAFIFGFVSSAIGFLVPSMLSMSAVRMTIEKSQKEGVQFSVGAASIVFAQCLAAVYFAAYLVKSPQILFLLKKAAIFILSALALYFFVVARKKVKTEGRLHDGNRYFVGALMSILNQLAIPYFLATFTLISSLGWIESTITLWILFALGAALGAFVIFYSYVAFAERIIKKARFITQNINYILSVFFVILTLIVVIQIIV
jgi:threonine/homoserine/homoserine lactone efflux protein